MLVDVHSAVRRLAKLLDIDFSFPKLQSRHKISSMPEIALMSLLVIVVKLYNPFDTIDRHPRSWSDAGTLALDWDRWCEAQKNYDSRDTADGKLGRGNEVKVAEADVFKMSGDQMDEYLDWFEKTWVDDERARNHPRGHPKQLLDMFPTGRSGGPQPATSNSEQERQDDEEALETKLKTTQGRLKPRQVIPEDDAGEDEDDVNRVGSYYKRYRKVEDLPATARAFHETAANLIAVKLPTLLVAIGQIEQRLIKWRERKVKEATTSDSEGDGDEQESEQEVVSARASENGDSALDAVEGSGANPQHQPGESGVMKAPATDSDSGSLCAQDDSS